jgi:hypothetical protein
MMAKKVVFALCFLMITGVGFAQDHMPYRANTYSDEGDGTGFRKENLFIGGGLDLGFGSYNFNIGVNPEIGYSLNRWLDVGAVINFQYNSVSADASFYYNNDVGQKQFVYGGGVFGRAYVLPFLFLTAQPEFNWTQHYGYTRGHPGPLPLQCQCAESVVGDRLWTAGSGR